MACGCALFAVEGEFAGGATHEFKCDAVILHRAGHPVLDQSGDIDEHEIAAIGGGDPHRISAGGRGAQHWGRGVVGEGCFVPGALGGVNVEPAGGSDTVDIQAERGLADAGVLRNGGEVELEVGNGATSHLKGCAIGEVGFRFDRQDVRVAGYGFLCFCRNAGEQQNCDGTKGARGKNTVRNHEGASQGSFLE
jgi:hypothetical protein